MQVVPRSGEGRETPRCGIAYTGAGVMATGFGPTKYQISNVWGRSESCRANIV
jgi:hypothetical protein